MGHNNFMQERNTWKQASLTNKMSKGCGQLKMVTRFVVISLKKPWRGCYAKDDAGFGDGSRMQSNGMCFLFGEFFLAYLFFVSALQAHPPIRFQFDT